MNRRHPRQALQSIRILHGAMATSVGLFGVVLWQLSKGTAAKAEAQVKFEVQLIIVAVAALVGAGLAALATARMKQVQADAQEGPAALARVMPLMILRIAGAEVVALGGFAATVMAPHAGFVPYFIGAGIALAIIALSFPRG